MVQTVSKGRAEMNKKRRVRISSQRQITIPIDFYLEMNLSDEAMIEFTGNEIIIRSAEQEIVDFSTDILKSLVAQGVSGDDLLSEFERIKKVFQTDLKQCHGSDGTAKTHGEFRRVFGFHK